MLDAGQQRHPGRQRHQMRSGHRSQLVGMAEGELAQKIPNVDGAYTSSNTRGVPPARSTLASSMLSAPHIITGDDRGQFAGRVDRPGFHPGRRQLHMSRSTPKTRLLSQFQHRHQSRAAPHILIDRPLVKTAARHQIHSSNTPSRP